MKLRTRHKYDNETDRRALAQMVSAAVMMGVNRGSFEPYKPNEHDDTYWTIDSGNDWKIQFFDDEPEVIEIIYRYSRGVPEKSEALARWVAARLGMEVLVESDSCGHGGDAPAKCSLCGDASADTLHVHSRCHTSAPLRAEIQGEKLTLFCYIPECNRKIVTYDLVVQEKRNQDD